MTETVNDSMVSIMGDKVCLMMPPSSCMSAEKAIRLAAWLVVMADIGGGAGRDAGAGVGRVRR
jgi:hypothetical protein